MELFENFVQQIVYDWPERQKITLAKGGEISARHIGDKAENYILYRVKKSIKSYYPVKTKGSRTPADIYAIYDYKDFFHIMLIQVKCSTKGEDKIKKLNREEEEELFELAKFVYAKYLQSDFSKSNNNKSSIITTGYAGVYFKKVRHSLYDTHFIHSYPENIEGSLKSRVAKIHEFKNI